MAAKNSALHQRNKLHFKIFKIDIIFLWQNLFHNITDFCCIFNQTNAALLSINVVLFQKQYKVLLISKLLNCLLLFYLYYLH